jgi:glycosyltransferase involved in cell wall biosynthesis
VIRLCYTVDAPFLGGAEYYVSRLATALDRNRFSVSLLMGDGGTGALEDWAAGLVAEGIPVVRTPMRLPWRLDDAPRLWRALDRLGPHVVHVNMPGPYSGQNALLAPIARAAGARVVTTEHLPMVAPLWKRRALKQLALRSVDVAVTMTQANASCLVERQRIAAERVRVVPNGVRRSLGENRHARRGNDEVVWLFVGNIIAHKGLHTTLEALSMVRPGWRLRVIGAGPDEARCRELTERLGLTPRVTFFGRQSPAEVERHLATADALVLPSAMEGLPYVILEAMASSLPVVAGDVYGIPEVVVDGETGFLVPPEDAPALAQALTRVIESAPLRARLGTNARRRFEERFTLERQVEAMSTIYERLARGLPGAWR